MDITDEHIKFIKSAFQKMNCKEDLLGLLNYSKRLIYGENTIALDLKQINYHSNPKANNNRYRKFAIKKKDGSRRYIYAPDKGLKVIQKCLNLIFQTIYQVNPSAKGFVPHRSIVDNASLHIGSTYVYNLDLKDFFSSIDQARLWGRLQHPPFNLNEKTKRINLANIIAALCCHEMLVERINEDGEWKNVRKNVLPQGAPTSPTISNIICQQLDFYLNAVAKRFGLKYSRYADDITFSSNHFVYGSGGEFCKEIQRIILSQNFHIKVSKTRLQKSGYRQEVTGLLVNENVNVQNRYIKQLRAWLYFWENFGYSKATAFFIRQYIPEKGHVKKGKANLNNVLAGKLDFLRMVKGSENDLYKKLNERYIKLSSGLKDDGIQLDGVVPVSNGSSQHLPIIHNPKLLVSYLKKFTVNNSALKYATHSWDAGQDSEVFVDYDEFIEKAKIEFSQFGESLKELNKNLWAKILSFLFNPLVKNGGWGSYRVKFGWSSSEIQEEMKKDGKRRPENIIIPSYAQFQLKTNLGIQTIQQFKQVIDIFKNEIEIRDENSMLLELILEFHDRHLNGFKIEKTHNLENKNFYTDVDYLRKVFTLVFENIQKRPYFKSVSYELVENKDSYTLELLHLDSIAKGLSIHDEKLTLKRGDFGIIAERLKNLCDWSIESVFKEGPYRLSYLVSDQNIPYASKIESADGFKYMFTFYK